jgi:hypothetical protein
MRVAEDASRAERVRGGGGRRGEVVVCFVERADVRSVWRRAGVVLDVEGNSRGLLTRG